MNRVNKKEMVKSYTSTYDVLELKKQMKAYQHNVNKLKKLIKHNKDLLKYFSNYNHQEKKTNTVLKGIESTIKQLQDFLGVYEDGVKIAAQEIQLQRQEVFESLCQYHPNKDVAKKRIAKERDDQVKFSNKISKAMKVALNDS